MPCFLPKGVNACSSWKCDLMESSEFRAGPGNPSCRNAELRNCSPDRRCRMQNPATETQQAPITSDSRSRTILPEGLNRYRARAHPDRGRHVVARQAQAVTLPRASGCSCRFSSSCSRILSLVRRPRTRFRKRACKPEIRSRPWTCTGIRRSAMAAIDEGRMASWGWPQRHGCPSRGPYSSASPQQRYPSVPPFRADARSSGSWPSAAWFVSSSRSAFATTSA